MMIKQVPLQTFLKIVCILSLSLALPCESNIQGSMGRFFESLGAHTNATGASSYQDQAAGYYSGGSLFVRNGVKHVQLASVDMPGLNAGCGGINMVLGGLSLISGDELVQLGRSVLSNAPAYGMSLALQTITPQIAGLMNELRAVAQKINAMSMNSCQSTQALVGSVWPKSQATSDTICRDMAVQNNMVSDWAKARHECGKQGQRDQYKARAKNTPGYDKLLGDNFNIAWEALKESSFLTEEPVMAELLMTFSGTLVVQKGDKKSQIRTLVSLADDDTMIQALLKGGAAPVYTCNEGGACLEPSRKMLKIAEGLEQKVQKVIEGILAKINDETPLTQAEISFLGSTLIPVYKILNVTTSYRRGLSAPFDIRMYAELIALDILFQYVLNHLDFMSEQLSKLKDSQLDTEVINSFVQGLHHARGRLYARQSGAMEHAKQVMHLNQKTKMMEQELHQIMGKAGHHE